MSNLLYTRPRRLIALALCLSASACGGGGGDEGGGGNLAPTAAFDATLQAGDAPLRVDFDASPSSDPDGNIVRYDWEFGDGATAAGAQTSHTFTSSGTHHVILTVTDNTGASASLRRPLVVFGEGSDPLAARQWHLARINAGGAWATLDDCLGDSGCQSPWPAIAVVDDGLELMHEDLAQNVTQSLAHRRYDSQGGRTGDPTPTHSGDYHGTAVAGIAAARAENGIGGRGVAPQAELVGYGVLQASTSANEADAMSYQAEQVAISNNSWGPADGEGGFYGPDSLWEAQIEQGLDNGRGGLGTVYVWAGGNGHHGSLDCPRCRDNSNYDGYANYHGVVAVGAVNAQGARASYSEHGANVWVSAPGGEFCSAGAPAAAITTTDLLGDAGLNRHGADDHGGDGTDDDLADPNYTQCMNGTSSATPVVSGVVALMLKANPELSWRDVRYILAQTADDRNLPDGDWTVNAAGHSVSHGYGFGVVDAEAAVAAASRWGPLAAAREPEVYRQTVATAVPDLGEGTTTVTVPATSAIRHIEWIDVVLDSDHSHIGDLRIVLRSPGGTESVLAEPHRCLSAGCGFDGRWRFASARHLDELPVGEWHLTVTDGAAQDSGGFTWDLVVHGR